MLTSTVLPPTQTATVRRMASGRTSDGNAVHNNSVEKCTKNNKFVTQAVQNEAEYGDPNR
jgi:hypothetical protein